MIRWDRNFQSILESANIAVRLYKRYVDDRFETDGFISSGILGSKHTDSFLFRNSSFKVIKSIADSVTNMLKSSNMLKSRYHRLSDKYAYLVC